MDVTDVQARIEWLCETYDLSEKEAKALLVSECGYSSSGVAGVLGVTEATARRYLAKLERVIGQGVTESVPKSVRYPTYPGDVPKHDVEYSDDYVEVRDDLADRDVSINRGAPLYECHGWRKA